MLKNRFNETHDYISLSAEREHSKQSGAIFEGLHVDGIHMCRTCSAYIAMVAIVVTAGLEVRRSYSLALRSTPLNIHRPCGSFVQRIREDLVVNTRSTSTSSANSIAEGGQ